MVEHGKLTVRIQKVVWRIETARKLTQFCVFIAFNAVLFGVGPWPVVLPVLYSLGVYHKSVGDAFATLQLMLNDLVFPWIPIASFILIAVLLGRTLCGWVCPFGFIQDLVGYVKSERELSKKTHDGMIRIKYVILISILLVSGTLAIAQVTGIGQGYKAALGEYGRAPFSVVSPADTLFAVIPKIVVDLTSTSIDAVVEGFLTIQPLLYVRLAVLAIVVVLAVYVSRSWCRYLCPHGALLALLTRFSFLGLTREPLKCTKATCRSCVEVCPMKVPILNLPWEKFMDPECIYCLKCVDACSTKAIKPKFP